MKEQYSGNILVGETKAGGDKVIRFDLLEEDLTEMLKGLCGKVHDKDGFIFFNRCGNSYNWFTPFV
jgi:hypothetical protein